MTCRNYTHSKNDNNNRFQDNLGCSAFTVCNCISPFTHNIKCTKIMSFFAVALKILQQYAYRGNTDASDNLLQRFQALWWSSALNEVPSWQLMEYLQSDMTWIRGTKNGGQSLCLLLPDPCLAHSHPGDIHCLFTKTVVLSWSTDWDSFTVSHTVWRHIMVLSQVLLAHEFI